MSQQASQSTSAKRANTLALSRAVKNSLHSKYWAPLSAALLFSSYAYAISLHDIKINSHIGEPLDATVFVSGVQNAKLAANCFSVLGPNPAESFPSISSAKTSVTRVANGYSVKLNSSTPVNEPISSLTLATSCKTLPMMQRTYTMMIDPAGVQNERVVQTIYQPANNTRSAQRLSNSSFKIQDNSAAIRQGQEYVVQAGDTLSKIATRIADRPRNSMWSVAASLYANNPQAFINKNPNFIELGSTLAIPTFDSAFVANETTARNSLLGQNADITNITNPIRNTVNIQSPQYQAMESSGQALATMTLSTSLSALSLQRIEARANGQVVSDSLLPNTQSLFGNTRQEKKQPRSPLETAASSIKQATEPKVVYVDRPAYPSEVQEKITAGISAGIAESKAQSQSSFTKNLTGLLAALVALGLVSWKFIFPFIRRRNRIAFIRSVRDHKQKTKHIERHKQRRNVLDSLSSRHKPLVTEIQELSESISHAQSNPIVEKSPLDLEKHAAEIEAAFTLQNETKDIPVTINPGNKVDSQAVVNKNNGPRKSNVAEEIYDVGMIDDTGELASLTMAFPELEAELNARLGGDIPNLGKDLPEQLPTRQADNNAETMTVQFERPSAESLDFEIPGLIDNDDGLEGDFESVVRDNSGEFSNANLFNEEIFSDDNSLHPFDEDSRESPTLSTEAISSDAVTRVSEIMIDEDGLTPADFGLKAEDFPVHQKDYAYLEPDASIETKSLNLSPEDLLELGFEEDDDNDNIIPFSKKSKFGKA